MKYIGIAVGQEITKTATPVTSIRAVDGIPDWLEIQKLLDTWKPTILIVGNPLQMDNSTQEITYCAQKFANRLRQKFKLPVYLVDERLTTWEAKKSILSRSTKLKTQQIVEINAKAAALLIEQWLNEQV